MRIPSAGTVRQSLDDDGNTVFTVKLETRPFSGDEAIYQQAAIGSVERELGAPVRVKEMRPLYDTTGTLIGYTIWVE